MKTIVFILLSVIGLFAAAGINAFVMSDHRSPMSRSGDDSGHTRISTHKEWISERISK